MIYKGPQKPIYRFSGAIFAITRKPLKQPRQPTPCKKGFRATFPIKPQKVMFTFEIFEKKHFSQTIFGHFRLSSRNRFHAYVLAFQKRFLA